MKHFEQIETYILGEMNASEKAAFEKLLQEDIALKKDFEDWKQTETIIAKHKTAEVHLPELTNTLRPLTNKYFHKENTQQKGKTISFKKYWYAAVAIAAVLLFFILMPPDMSRYEINPMPGAVVRGTQDENKIGAKLFNEKNYKEALPFLKQNAETHPEDATANFYFGITMIKVEKFQDALPVFEKLIQGNSAYKEDSYFFAALAAYKSNEKSIASKYAAQVPENNQYYKNAQRILKKTK
jgi:tetratricopeptide (TPR) repeat protein